MRAITHHGILMIVCLFRLKYVGSITLASHQTNLTMHGYTATWNKAQATCVHNGGMLFTEDSPERKIVLESYMPQWDNKHVWVGLHSPSTVTDGEYGWTDCFGQDLTNFDNWKASHPEDATTQRCAFRDKNTAEWKGDTCQGAHRFVCQNEGDPCYFTTGSGIPTPSIDFEVLNVTSGDSDLCKWRCLNSIHNYKNCWAVAYQDQKCTMFFTTDPFLFNGVTLSTSNWDFYIKNCYNRNTMVSSANPLVTAVDGTNPDSNCNTFTTQTTPSIYMLVAPPSTTAIHAASTSTPGTTTSSSTTTAGTTSTSTSISASTTTTTVTVPSSAIASTTGSTSSSTSSTTNTPTTSTSTSLALGVTTPSSATTLPIPTGVPYAATTSSSTFESTTTSLVDISASSTTSTSTSAAPVTTSNSISTASIVDTSASSTTSTRTSTGPSTTSSSEMTTSLVDTSASTTTSTSTSTQTSSASTNTSTPTTSTSTSTTSVSTISSSSQTPPTSLPTISTTNVPPTPFSVITTNTAPNNTCLCTCSGVATVLSNMTLQEKLDYLHLKLKVDHKALSSSIRKKTSAKDDRPTSQSVGYVAIIFGCIELSLLMAGDVMAVLSYLRDKFSM